MNGLLAVASEEGSSASRGQYVTWAVIGAMAALVVLGGLSIGLYLVPAVLAFLIAALLIRRSTGVALTRALVAAGLGAVAQSMLILLTGTR